MMLSMPILQTDLILEIICKLKYSDLKLLLTSKKTHFSYLSNKKWVTKNIVNSYNLIFTDLSNILFIKNKKVNETELISAVKNGHLENVKFLLKNGASIHVRDNFALRYASMYGHTEIVKLLIKSGADIHACENEALRFASGRGYIEIVKLLIEAGADIHAYSDEALRWASGHGHIEIVKLLIETGADIHTYNDYALRWASQGGHTEIVKLLKSLK